MIVVVGGIKGGTGKTTIATNLCQLRASTGKKVLLVDGDDQQSSYEWSLQRDYLQMNSKKKYSNLAKFETICLSGQVLYKTVLKRKDEFDDIFIDTGGRDSGSQRAAICCADILIFPFKPRSIDIWTLSPVKKLIQESLRPSAKAYSILNQADHQGPDNRDALQVLSECELIKPISILIKNRKSFANACATGLGVHEMEQKDEKACKEIKDLYEAIYG